MRRLEDGVFLRGEACYTDDIVPEGVLFGHVLRSPVAHAAFEIGDLEQAQNAPGVHLVFNGTGRGASERAQSPFGRCAG